MARHAPAAARSLAIVAGASLLLGVKGTANVDVVVAHHNEDLSWVNQFVRPEVRFHTYSKGKQVAGITKVSLPNIGRESHTYLYHIVENYDHLANWTVFTQGQRPAWGYLNGNSYSGHLTDRIRFEDYLVPYPGGRDSFFAISAATHLPDGVQSTRLGILTEKLEVVSNDICPANGTKGWSSWWFDSKHPHHRAGLEMLEFYHRQIRQDAAAKLTPLTLGFVQGARFAVSRDRIRMRPREYYASLRRVVSKDKDPLAGYFLEAMWYDVFHPESDQSLSPLCPYQDLPSGAAMSLSEMYADTARRLGGSYLLRAADAYAPTTTTTPAPPRVTRVVGSFAMSTADAYDVCDPYLVNLTGTALATKVGSSPDMLHLTCTHWRARRLADDARRLHAGIATLAYSFQTSWNEVGGASDPLTLQTLSKLQNLTRAQLSDALNTQYSLYGIPLTITIAALGKPTVQCDGCNATTTTMTHGRLPFEEDSVARLVPSAGPPALLASAVLLALAALAG